MAHIIIIGRYSDGTRMLMPELAESHAAARERADAMNSALDNPNHAGFEHATSSGVNRRYKITEPVRICDCEHWEAILTTV